MGESENTSSSEEFVVRQSTFYNVFLGTIFLAIFVGVLFTIRGQSRFNGSDYMMFAAMFLVPGIGLFINGSRKNLVFKLNSVGIYFGNTLLTPWDRLVRAYTSEVGEDEGYKITFALFVEYYPTNSNIPYIITLPLPATIDKSVEEISAAIEQFSNAK